MRRQIAFAAVRELTALPQLPLLDLGRGIRIEGMEMARAEKFAPNKNASPNCGWLCEHLQGSKIS